MLLPDRRFFLLGPLALAACGFTPVYGPDGNGGKLQNRVQVDEPATREGYLLTRQLETRLGRAGNAAYGLTLNIATTQEGMAINTEGDITRYNLLGAVDYSLQQLNSGEIVTSGRVDHFTGYSATGTTVAILAAERDAQGRLMNILAEQIIRRLFAADLPA